MTILIILGILAAVIIIGFLFAIILLVRELSSGSLSSWSLFTTPGQRGENRVKSKLSWLNSKEYFIINDLLFRKNNGLTIQIDHVVVSPYGVFVIETKNISGYIYGSETSNQWLRRWKGYARGGRYKEDELSFDNPIRQNEVHIDALSERLGRGLQIPYYSIIVFSPEATLKVKTSQQNVIYWSELRDYIYRFKEPVMSVEEAQNVYENIVALNVTDPKVRNMHAASANARKKNYEIESEAAVSNGKCPRCGGNLVLRQGTYGAFYGCSNYPKCRYTHQV